ncbi:MAG: endo-1,3-alpha-glucanase family glycosylhydrolase [Janthinobacterium lividum]
MYVTPQGNDSWSGQSPTPTGDGGPFQTLFHAQETVKSLTDAGLTEPVEVTFDPGVCNATDFVSRWFTSSPTYPVIWHSDSSRTVLIYTPTMAEQNDALSAEDYTTASQGATARFYVSPEGSDDWSGHAPMEDADNGPFLTLSRAQDAVNAFQADNPNAPVEVVVEAGLSTASGLMNGTSDNLTLTSAKHKMSAHATQKPATATKSTLKGSALVKSGALVAAATPSHLVFAHYTMACRDYGGSVAGYEHDIQDAQAAGVDGFAMNCAGWTSANYKVDCASMFQAAQALNTGFKLFFSADMTGSLSAADIQDMVKTYGNNPNYFHYSGRPVLSTWTGDGGTPTTVINYWQNSVLTPLRNAGYNVYFVPNWSAASSLGTTNGNFTGATVQTAYQLIWKTLVDGLYQVSLAPPVNYAYSRTVPAAAVVPGQQSGLTVWDAHAEHYYDPTHEFSGDDVGRTITITGNANFTAGTYTISHFDGGYGVTDLTGKPLGNHNLITLVLIGSTPAKHYDATGGGYTVQSASSAPQKGSTLLAQETYAQVLHANGKSFMSSVSPQYWGSLRADVGRCYNEFYGGEGLSAQWNSVISVQKPELVEIFTWNDFAEGTYCSPIDDVAKYWPYALPGTNNNVVGYMKSHAGFTALNKYFINWYKSGVKPAITKDSIYYFYRTNPKNAVATNDNRGPVTGISGDLEDDIYVTANLTAPATLAVTTGTQTLTYSVPAGMSNTRVPFQTGSQSFQLLRGGKSIISQSGQPIVKVPTTYNFNLYSGTATD